MAKSSFFLITVATKKNILEVWISEQVVMVELSKILPDQMPGYIKYIYKIRHFPWSSGTMPSESFFHIECLGHDQWAVFAVHDNVYGIRQPVNSVKSLPLFKAVP